MNSYLKPLKLSGDITLPHRIFPGPMEGVMNPLFCKTAEQLNLVDFWMTPFLRVTTGPTGKAKIVRFTERYSRGGKTVIVQLMGKDPGYLIETAYRCKELGFAGVNFNLACPSKQVISSGSGGALLKNHKFIRELMTSSAELGQNFSVSLKIRTGFASPDEIEEIAKFANPASGDSFLDFVVVHHRTVSEGYDMVPEREERLTKATKCFGDIPVIANGDIYSHEDAKYIVNKTGCAGVMVARNWLKNPNLIRDIEHGTNSTSEEIQQSFASFINNMAVNAHKNHKEGNRNSMIDMVSRIFKKKHPFFKYITLIPFEEPSKELTKDKILSLILK